MTPLGFCRFGRGDVLNSGRKVSTSLLDWLGWTALMQLCAKGHPFVSSEAEKRWRGVDRFSTSLEANGSGWMRSAATAVGWFE